MTDVLFYNVWHTETPEKRARLIAAMREEAPSLASKPGFEAMTVFESDDGRVLVEAHWASREAFDTAITDDPGAQTSRRSLEAFGTAEPGVFTQAFRIDRSEAPSRNYPSAAFWERFTRHDVTVNGVKFRVVEGGQGEPILLIPGMLETWAVWHRVLPWLAGRYRVIAPDLRGIGESEGSGTDYDKVTLAGDMLAVIDTLGIGRFHVIGHDFGGQIAYALAAQNPQRIATLTVIESLLPGITVRRRAVEANAWLVPFHATPAIPEMLVEGHERGYVRALWEMFVAPDSEVTEDDRAEVERAFARPGVLCSSFGFYRSIAKDLDDFNPLYTVKLATPVLALGGENSFERRTLETYQQVATDVIGGIIEGAAHYAPLERSEATATPILNFLASHPLRDGIDVHKPR